MRVDAIPMTLRAALLSVVLFGCFLFAWQLLSASGQTEAPVGMDPELAALLGPQAKGESAFPAPAEVFSELKRHVTDPFYDAGPNDKGIGIQLAYSIMRVLVGFGLAALGNIELAVKSRNPSWSSAQIRAHAMKYLELVNLGEAADRKPAQLSGGMKQRVGIARALSLEPDVLLMDEPFSALDALTRGGLQDEILAICDARKQTSFMITHDVDEALYLADKIVLMTNGPEACIAEIVENTLPRDRTRESMFKHPRFYPMRNHLMDFLVTRSKSFTEEIAGTEFDKRHPPVVSPGIGVSAVHPVDTEIPEATSPGKPQAPRHMAGG